jgi:hypothetical protein
MTTFTQRNGDERRLITSAHPTNGSVMVATFELSGDVQHASAFVCKTLTRQLLNDDSDAALPSAELLECYKHGNVALAVLNFVEEGASKKAILQHNRFHVNVITVPIPPQVVSGEVRPSMYNFSPDCKTLKYLVPDFTLVSLASKPHRDSGPALTILDRYTFADVKASFDATPPEARDDWFFPLCDSKYGTTVIKWTNDAFCDHTSNGPQVVKCVDDLDRSTLGKPQSARGERVWEGCHRWD